jgi:hypothetical protein
MKDTYSLEQSFCIDDGELAGFSPQKIFVLGFEFAAIYYRVLIGLPFKTIFHSDNHDRIVAMLKDQNVADWDVYADSDDWHTVDVITR